MGLGYVHLSTAPSTLLREALESFFEVRDVPGLKKKPSTSELLDWLKAEARRLECAEIHLDSGTQREDAHRFYFREGLTINCFHFRQKL